MKEEFERIKGILKETNSWFKVIKHKPVFTSEEAARARGVELRQGVKAMVFKLKEKFVVALVPADRKVDTKKLKKLVGGKPKLASPEEVFAVTNCKIGAVPPFGHKTKLEIFADIGIFANDMVDFNAGLNEVSIQMHGNDLK
ncbi:MAG TPA: hypothetical protein ENG42_03610, partial [Candidatus Aenigmarchaeota archaeon]|nr:hypothetical protein [Candidatus Aenigmarchaeota archaeon]